jgi:hypothetical protein
MLPRAGYGVINKAGCWPEAAQPADRDSILGQILRTVRQSQPHSRPIQRRLRPQYRAPCPTARGVVTSSCIPALGVIASVNDGAGGNPPTAVRHRPRRTLQLTGTRNSAAEPKRVLAAMVQKQTGRSWIGGNQANSAP